MSIDFPYVRPRRLRATAAIRELVAETRLHPAQFIAPLFVMEGENSAEAISSMPGYYRLTVDKLIAECLALYSLGVRAVLLFAKVPATKKDPRALEALNPEGLLQQAVRAVKRTLPALCVMTDVALDPYNSDGHDGLVENGLIVNDATNTVLAEMALSHAEAGADIVAPSDMMDGRIAAIRGALELAGHVNTGILAYSAKYASCFYGPFRDALDSAPGFGDKKTYQMNPANRREAVREALLDVAEGADIVMVKPGLPYLDIVREVRNAVPVPVAVYQISGEYAMIKAAAERGWLDERSAMLETLTAIVRSGADMVATYFARPAAEALAEGHS